MKCTFTSAECHACASSSTLIVEDLPRLRSRVLAILYRGDAVYEDVEDALREPGGLSQL